MGTFRGVHLADFSPHAPRRRDFFPLPSASASRSCPTPTCSLPEAPLLNSPPLPAIPASASSLSSPPSADSPMRRDWRDAVVAEERDAGGAGGEAFWRKVFERTFGERAAHWSRAEQPRGEGKGGEVREGKGEGEGAGEGEREGVSESGVWRGGLEREWRWGGIGEWSLGDPPLGPDSCSRAVTADACNEDRWCACNEDIWCACNEDGSRLVASAAEDGSVCVWSLPRWPTRGDGSSTPQALQAGANVREAGSEVVPAGSEVVPAGSEVVPAGSEVVPAGSEVVPAGSEVVPAGSEVVPAGSEVVPAGSEVVPAGFQVVQEGSAEALLAGSTSERRGFGGTCVAIVPCAAPWCSLWFVQGAMGEQQLWQDLERVGRGEGNTEGGEGGAGGEGGEGEEGEGEQVRWRPRKGKRGPREWWEGGVVTERRTCKGETPCPRPRYLLVEGRDGGTDIFSSYSMRLWDLGSAGFFCTSPTLTSPTLTSPTLTSPTLTSPTLTSPTLTSPQTVQGGFPGVFARLWDVDASAVAALLSQVRPTLPGAPYTPTLPGAPYTPALPHAPSSLTCVSSPNRCALPPYLRPPCHRCALPRTGAPPPQQVCSPPNKCSLPPQARLIPHSPRYSKRTISSPASPPPPLSPLSYSQFLLALPHCSLPSCRPIPHSPRFSTWTPSSSQQPPPPFPPSFSPLFLQACPPFTDILHLDSQQPCIAPYSATAVVLRADGLVALWTGIQWPDHTVPICPDTVGAVRVCKYCAIEFKGGAFRCAQNTTVLRFAVPQSSAFSNPAVTIFPQKVAADGDYAYRHGGTIPLIPLPLHFSPPPSCAFLSHYLLPCPSSPTSAIAKPQLQRPENATILRLVVPYTASVLSPSFTIFPQKVAADGAYDYRHGGTMYFGWTAVNPTPGAPNETVLVANFTTMGAFAITGTSALGTSEAETVVEPHCAAVNTPPYFVPGPVEQKPGPVPLAWAMNTTMRPIGPGYVAARSVVVFPRRRQMWISFMSAFGKDMSASAVVARLRLSLRLERQWRPFRVFLERFKAVGVGGGNSLIQPNIALNRQGVGIMAASLTGRSFYPSAAYATLNANVDVGRINVVGAGKAPLDDYFGYLSDRMLFSNYMAATVDEEGNAWAAVQYVAGQPRTEWSNWGTFVFKVTLHEGEVGGGGNGGDGVNGDNGGNGDTSGNGDDGGNGDTSGNGDDGGNGDTSGNGDDGGNGDTSGNGDDGGNGDTSGNGDDGGNGDTSGNGDDGGNGDTSGNGDDGGNGDHEGK
ncbi:unnamed protein product [Closterium sp. Naga37s-1]|nr:unnamed protein product [Closterium sp. Naga37s-1]